MLWLATLLVPLICLPKFVDHYDTGKWVGLYALVMAVLIRRMLQPRPLFLPKLKPSTLLVLFLLFVSVGFASGDRRQAWLDLTTLTLLSLEFFHQLLTDSQLIEKVERSNLIALSLVIAYGALQLLGFEPFPLLKHNEFPVSTLGYQNITAEFLGFSLVLQLTLSARINWPRLIALAVSLGYFVLLNSRVNQVALVVTGVVLLFIHRPQRVGVKSLVLGFLIVAMVGFFSVKGRNRLVPLFNPGVQLAKQQTLTWRAHRWLNTLNLIRQKPWGVGFQNYEFAYIPFSHFPYEDPEITENTLARTAHNDYLEAFAEGGWFFGGMVLLTLGIFWFKLIQLGRSGERSRWYLMLVGLSTYFAIDALGDFPICNAFPFLCLSFALGTLWFLENRKLALTLNLPILLAPLGILFFVGWSAGNFAFAEYVEANYFENAKLTQLACRFNPYQWKVCLQFAYSEFNSGHSYRAKPIVDRILANQPENFVAAKAQFEILTKADLPIQACQSLSRFLTLARGENSLNYEWLKSCRSYPD